MWGRVLALPMIDERGAAVCRTGSLVHLGRIRAAVVACPLRSAARVQPLSAPDEPEESESYQGGGYGRRLRRDHVGSRGGSGSEGTATIAILQAIYDAPQGGCLQRVRYARGLVAGTSKLKGHLGSRELRREDRVGGHKESVIACRYSIVGEVA